MKEYISKDGLKFSELSLGCMNLPNDEDKVREIIEYALSEGVSYFDTADLYQFGKNETVLGKVLPKLRAKHTFTLGTKVGNEFDAEKEKQLGWNPTAKHIKNSVKDSLSRLNIEEIDLYQLHGGTIDDDMDETIEAFEDLKTEGIIKSYGISSIRLNVIDYYDKNSNISTLMSQFNPIDNRPIETLNTIDKDIVLLARGPLMQGLFTDNYEKALVNKFQDGILNYSYDELERVLRELKDTFGDLSKLSYAFLKYHDTVIVNGVSTLDQLKDNVKSFKESKTLTEDEMATLKNIVKLERYEEHRV